MNKAVLVFLVVAVSAVHGYAVNSHQGAAVEQQQYDARDAVRGIRGRGYEILKRAARDLFHTVSEERAKSQASWSQLYKSAYPEIEGRALNPLGSVGMNLAFGLGTLVLGLAGMSFGGSTVARSLKTAYDGIEWRSGLVAMTRDDFLERTFDWMDVKDATCKQRMICEVEQYAADQSTFKTLILKFLSKRHPGLQAYKEAVDAGLDYLDCSQVYPECPMSSLQLLGNVPLDRLGLNADYLAAIPWAKIAESLNVV